MLTLFSLAGQVALVTGGGQGNGRSIAIGLAGAGASVAILDRVEGTAVAVADEIRKTGGKAVALTADITRQRDCDIACADARRQLGPISILVNNAGVNRRGQVEDADAIEKWRETFAVNVDGQFYMVRAALKDLMETRGTIINVGSIQSFVAPLNTSTAYTASKNAILGMTKALAAELAPAGIRVNGIAPGMFETPMTAPTRANPEKMAALHRHIPMKRIGQPDELMGVAIFLASQASRYVTGAMIPVDGGYLAI